MSKGITIKLGYTSSELRRLAASSRHANQSRRLLSIAAALDGMSRAEAAKIGGMDRQTLRDWVHRFNARGPEGLKDDLAREKPRRLSATQQAELAEIVETGPDRAVDGVVRWRRIDLQRVIAERFGVQSPRAHHRQAAEASRASRISAPAAAPQARWRGHRGLRKKLRQDACGASRGRDAQAEDRDLVPGRGPHRPEERPCPTMGQAGNAAVPARGPALRSAYLFGAICPARGVGARAGAALRRHRRHAAASRRDIPARRQNAHAVLLLDRAGWHTTGNLVWPRNITPILLPSRSPELNPVEQVWQYLRANFLSNRVFEAYDDNFVAAACDAWNRLIAKPHTITSIGMRQWANTGQL